MCAPRSLLWRQAEPLPHCAPWAKLAIAPAISALICALHCCTLLRYLVVLHWWDLWHLYVVSYVFLILHLEPPFWLNGANWTWRVHPTLGPGAPSAPPAVRGGEPGCTFPHTQKVGRTIRSGSGFPIPLQLSAARSLLSSGSKYRLGRTITRCRLPCARHPLSNERSAEYITGEEGQRRARVGRPPDGHVRSPE